MTDIEKQREAIEAARRWEEDMAVHRMELQNMAAHKMELQTAKQKEKFMVTTDDVLNTMTEKIVKKMKEEKDYLPSLDELQGIAYLIEARTNYARSK